MRWVTDYMGLCWYEPEESGLPLKEVIQPQVPLRLPCYDFTPVTTQTFGTCPSKRVGFQRLLVQATSMV